MNDEEELARLRQMAETAAQLAAERAVEHGFARLGIDLEEAERWRKNLEFAESQRIGREEAGRIIRRGGLLILLSTVGWLLLEGLKQAFKGNVP